MASAGWHGVRCLVLRPCILNPCFLVRLCVVSVARALAYRARLLHTDGSVCMCVCVQSMSVVADWSPYGICRLAWCALSCVEAMHS